MSARTRIVDRWRTRLAESQQRVVGCPAHRRWIHHVYSRVYRFLIACYGIDEWQTDGDADCDRDTGASRMEFVDNTRSEQGTPPKSAERIRATLDAVHDARENQPQPGKRGGGLEFDDWIAVASESGLVSPRRFVRLLRLNDIESRQVRRGDDVIVEVFAGRREEASEILEANRPSLRIRPRNRRGSVAILRGIGNVCFGGFMGGVAGFLPMVLLIIVLDAVLQPRSSASAGAVFSTVIWIGWGVFVLGGMFVCLWRSCTRKT